MSAKPVGSIPLLRFFAGELRCGLVAAAVERMEGARPGYRQASEILGSQPGPSSDQRTLHLFVEGRRGSVLVDGPTAVCDLQAADVLPLGRSLSFLRNGPVLGLAREGEHLVLLIDVAWLVARLP